MIKASPINTHEDCLLLLKITMKVDDRFSNVLPYHNKILAILCSGAEAPILWPPDAGGWLAGKDPEAGKDWGQEEKRAPEDETLDGITDSVDLSLSKFWKAVKDREAWHAAVHRLATSWTRLSNWTTTTKPYASSSWSKSHSPKHQPLPNDTSVTTGWWSKKVKALVTQSHTTLCDPMGWRPPASSVHEILQTRTLEWVAISFSRGSSWLRDRTRTSCIAGRFFPVWAHREAGKMED